jgi:hypothetical protein
MKTTAVHTYIETLELTEVMKMFRKYHIPMEYQALKSLFRQVGKKTGSITLDEFKKFSLSEEAKHSTRISRVQRNHDQRGSEAKC